MGDRSFYMSNILKAAKIKSFISSESTVFETEARAGYTTCSFYITRNVRAYGKIPGLEAVRRLQD